MLDNRQIRLQNRLRQPGIKRRYEGPQMPNMLIGSAKEIAEPIEIDTRTGEYKNRV